MKKKDDGASDEIVSQPVLCAGVLPQLRLPRGMRCLAEKSRNSLRSEGSIWDDSFDSNTRGVLAVADRLKKLDINLMPAVREFRAAMDEPNPRGFVPHCRTTLDAWIAANP